MKGAKANAEAGVLTVETVDASYFITNEASDNLYYFGENCTIYDVTAGGAEVDSLSRGDQVQFVVSTNDPDTALIVYIIG